MQGPTKGACVRDDERRKLQFVYDMEIAECWGALFALVLVVVFLVVMWVM